MEIALLVLLALVAWYWMDSLAAREVALNAGRKACEREGLQFLDETVALSQLRLARNEAGTLALQRTFGFEFSDTGNNRRKGHVTLLGREVTMLYTGLQLVMEGQTRVL